MKTRNGKRLLKNCFVRLLRLLDSVKSINFGTSTAPSITLSYVGQAFLHLLLDNISVHQLSEYFT